MTPANHAVKLELMQDAELGGYCAAQVERARERMQRGTVEGERAGHLLRELSASFDQLLRALFARAAPGSAPLSLVALGGYGRRQLYPYSDIDLLILPGAADSALVERVLTGVVYPLWDARVSVGHAVRTIDETLELAHTDLTMCTSLLDARLVAGDEGPFFALEAGAYREFFGGERVNDFIDALVAEREKRHPRFGETVYLLEPNIKSGSGGLRDVNTSLWAAKACFGVPRLSELAAVGAATVRQQSALLEARDFLRRLRVSMHLTCGRAQDQLLFEVQEALAPQLFPDEPIPGVARIVEEELAVKPAVERLMHAYYRHARTVVLETEGILQRCAVRRSARQPQRRQLDTHFYAVGGRLHTDAPERFWEQPSELVRAFVVAMEHNLRFDRALKDVIAEAAASAPGLALRADEQALALFRQLLRDPERADRRSALDRMHDMGVLNAVVPEFEPCTGRVQHDLYHVYTVDRHSLYVVDMLKALRRGDLGQERAMPTTVMGELQMVETLYLAALLHDVAKPLGTGHSRKGARVAAGVAARLGLSAEELEEVVFLVRHHLAMPHLSQRRDLADPGVIESFAQLVGNVGRLRRLYLLSVADTAMTSPDNLTDWKASLLSELFASTYRRLTSGSAAQPRAVLDGKRTELRTRLVHDWGEASHQMIERLPDDLLAGHSVDALVHHVGVALELEQAPGKGRLRLGTRRHDPATTVVTVCCEDAPGLLSIITGAMVLHRIQVLAAQVYTLHGQPGQEQAYGTVLDIFWVTTADPVDFRSWLEFSATLEGALDNEQLLAQRVAERIRPSGLPPRVVPPVKTEVLVDNEASERATIIELHAADMRGLLHTVTHKLTELDLQIDLAKVTTQAGQVSDIFYVRDRSTGAKLHSDAHVTRVCSSVKQAVDRLATATRRRRSSTGPLKAISS